MAERQLAGHGVAAPEERGEKEQEIGTAVVHRTLSGGRVPTSVFEAGM